MASFEDQVKGCLVGAVIGAELGFARQVEGHRFRVDADHPDEALKLPLTPSLAYQEDSLRTWIGRATPLVDLGVRTYLHKKGRATPEDFGALLKDDVALAGPVFWWLDLHTAQELLREGMSPRLSGLGNMPCGNISAAMPAVGIFHAGDPEYAYLDGGELASVVQPRLGADWAALAAAAVAAAFQPGVTGPDVVETVLKLAHRVNKDLFYALNHLVAQARGRPHKTEFAAYWLWQAGRTFNVDSGWPGHNPIGAVLPLLERFSDNPREGLALAVLAGTDAHIKAAVAGAALGALGGLSSWPAEWREWAEPLAQEWFPLIDVARSRLSQEAQVIQKTERMAHPTSSGESLLFDKIYGCLLAGAIGNAMGSVAEAQHYWEVDARHPQGITTILDPSRLEGEDDNQMAMLLVETYLAREGLPATARDFGRTWADRLNRDHFFYCMKNAYDLLRQGWDPRITGHWNIVTGSTVMCMEPVGIYHAGDPDYAWIDATGLSYLYQRGLDVLAAALLAATVAEAFQPEATVESICQAALRVAPRTKMATFDSREMDTPHAYLSLCLEVADRYTDVLAARKELYERCLYYHCIDPLELWGLSLAMFKIARGDVRQAAIGGTNIGRDADTIAGRAAMLSGALRGAQGVPTEWSQMFREEDLQRIRRNAQRFEELVTQKKLPRLRERQRILQT